MRNIRRNLLISQALLLRRACTWRAHGLTGLLSFLFHGWVGGSGRGRRLLYGLGVGEHERQLHHDVTEANAQTLRTGKGWRYAVRGMYGRGVQACSVRAQTLRTGKGWRHVVYVQTTTVREMDGRGVQAWCSVRAQTLRTGKGWRRVVYVQTTTVREGSRSVTFVTWGAFWRCHFCYADW